MFSSRVIRGDEMIISSCIFDKGEESKNYSRDKQKTTKGSNFLAAKREFITRKYPQTRQNAKCIQRIIKFLICGKFYRCFSQIFWNSMREIITLCFVSMTNRGIEHRNSSTSHNCTWLSDLTHGLNRRCLT